MGGVFDSRKYEQPAQQRDTELTLTPPVLLVMIAALVALCGVCFALGYSSGRRGGGDTQAVATPSTDGSIPVPAASGQPKPPANPQASTAAATTSAVVQPDADSSPTNDQTVAAAEVPNAQPQVKQAVGAVIPVAGQVAAGAVAPALGQQAQVMVQIAAVGQEADADVLVSALRRRGYAVGARREPLDGLIHVKIGPFKTAAEAESWQQKLLNDGYNAEIQQ